LVKRIHLAARLAHLPREAKQQLLLPHLALRCGVTLEPMQSNRCLLRERESCALITYTKPPSQTQVCMELIIYEHGNAQPSNIDRRTGQRRLKRCHTPNHHRLACVSDTREQVLRSCAQLYMIS
jgi:hypothetical protein